MIVAIYTRVSTDEQTTQNQIKSLENEAARLVQEVKTKPDV